MTSRDHSESNVAQESFVSVDRIPLTNLLGKAVKAEVSRQGTKANQFWSTPPRRQQDSTQEVIEFSFTEPRLVNYLKMSTAHFPHTVTAQWWDDDVNIWLPLNMGIGGEARYSVSDSMPMKVDSQNDGQASSGSVVAHPQHLGGKHWMQVAWKVSPVTTKKIRMILVRSAGSPPSDPRGLKAPYSLGLRDVQIGYRVNSRSDIPSSATIIDQDFGSSIDLLGSRVLFSLKEQSARNVLTSGEGKSWRSEPQPVNYSVVNFYADTRDASGEGQVIDRFFIDPLTVGAHLNLYYSNDLPDTTFRSLDEPLGYPMVQSFGASCLAVLDPQQTVADKSVFSGTEASYVDVDNAYLQFDPAYHDWWLGLEQEATTGANGVNNGTADHPWVSFGGNTLRLNGSVIEFVSVSGKVASIPLDADHDLNAQFSIAVIFNRPGTPRPPEGYPAGLTLVYRLVDRPSVSVTLAMTANDLGARPSTFSIGRYNDDTEPGLPALTLRALVLKVDAPPTKDHIDRFVKDGSIFAKRAEFAGLDSGATDNALLRMHPSFSQAATNPVGMVGGSGDRFSDMVWTPISRDYVLRKGYLQLPPTRARSWKFEFTSLIAEHFESFVPIRRQIKMYPSSMVSAYSQMTSGMAFDPTNGGAGVKTLMSLSDVARYSDALNIARTSGSRDATHSATEALYVHDPVQATRVAKAGWIWGFQPWHVGSVAPKFLFTQKHVYETLTVDHVTKIGYFAGIKTLQAFRVNYLVEDETEIYYEHFHDQSNTSASSGVTWGVNKVTSFSSGSQVTSGKFLSTRPVRAIQFSSLQSDAYPMLADDGFFDPDLSKHWSVYGDGTVTRQSNQTVTVNRGWFHLAYGQVEAKYLTYGQMDGHRYGELEGALANGTVGGGINSESVTPGDSGRVYAAVKVSAKHTLSGPVRLEIVSVLGNHILASVEREVFAGQEEVFYVGYTVGTVSEPILYSAIEGDLYGDLDGTTYGSHQNSPISGNIYARLIQPGRLSDTFTVRRLSLFDAPLSWEFSNDDGASWFDAMDVRNDPDGVLTFPVADTKLRWRLRMFRPGMSVSALAFRPWYGGLFGSTPGNGGQKVMGPNRSVMDEYPDIHADPMWQQSHSPIPDNWFHVTPTRPKTEDSSGQPIDPIGPPPPAPIPLFIDALVWQEPQPDITAPGPVTSLTGLALMTSSQLDWTWPTNQSFWVMLRRLEGTTPPATQTDGVEVRHTHSSEGLTNTLDDTGLTPNTTYSYSVFTHDNAGNYSAPVSVTVTTIPDPLAGVAIGDYFMDGFFAGIIDTTRGNIIPTDASQVGERYALIVAPKSMESASQKYKTVNTAAVPAALTRWDGLAATDAMVADAETYSAADYCSAFGYSADGASKWYLPAMDEMDLVYQNLKSTTHENTVLTRPIQPYTGMWPIVADTTLPESPAGENPSSDPVRLGYTYGVPARTLVAGFIAPAAQALGLTYASQYFWTSTDARYTSGGYAWMHSPAFTNAGWMTYQTKSTNNRVRPVRRLLLPQAPPPTIVSDPSYVVLPVTEEAFYSRDMGGGGGAITGKITPDATHTFVGAGPRYLEVSDNATSYAEIASIAETASTRSDVCGVRFAPYTAPSGYKIEQVSITWDLYSTSTGMWEDNIITRQMFMFDVTGVVLVPWVQISFVQGTSGVWKTGNAVVKMQQSAIDLLSSGNLVFGAQAMDWPGINTGPNYSFVDRFSQIKAVIHLLPV